jgi:uncharacterized UBP type Zn finger protein
MMPWSSTSSTLPEPVSFEQYKNVRLRNYNAKTCYMNSTIQAFLHTPYFAQQMQQQNHNYTTLSTTTDNNIISHSSSVIMTAFNKLFAKINNQPATITIIEPLELYNSLPILNLDQNRQNEAQEFFSNVIEYIEPNITSRFEGKTTCRKTCLCFCISK